MSSLAGIGSLIVDTKAHVGTSGKDKLQDLAFEDIEMHIVK